MTDIALVVDIMIDRDGIDQAERNLQQQLHDDEMEQDRVLAALSEVRKRRQGETA